MEEPSLTGVLVKVHNGSANPKDVREFLDHLLSQNLNYTVTWQTIEAFNSILETCTDDEANEELLDVLFDSFNYVSENSCDENSWSDFGFELSGLIAKFLKAIQNSRQFGHFFCKLLLAINFIVKHNQDIWRSVSRLLLNIFINKKLSFSYLQDSLKSFIYILRNIDSSALITFARQNLKLLCSFSMMIQSVGDFESQFDVLEIIFLHILDDRELAKEFFTQNEEIAKLFQNLDFRRFEIDCRIFINSLNAGLGSEKKVFTINCNQFSLGGQSLELLEEEKCIWFDANVKSKRLSIACSSFDSDTISLGSRCLIFIPMMDVMDFKAQVGTTSGEDCYCFKISIKNLTQSYQGSRSNEIICTALQSCNTEEDIGYFMDFLEFFKKKKALEKSSCTEGILITPPRSPEKENPVRLENTEGLFLPNFTKLNKGLVKEKKVQYNAVSSSNREPTTTALDLFKEVENKPKRKSYGIFIGGGLTEPLVLQHCGAASKLSPRRNTSSDEGESSPRRSARLKNKSDVSYCEDDVIPGTDPIAKVKNQSPKRVKKNEVVLSPTEFLQEKLKKKISPEVQIEKEKIKKSQPKKTVKKKQLFSSQENATQVFDDVSSSPVEKDLPPVTPKKYLDPKKKSPAPRQGKSPAPRRGKSLPDKAPQLKISEKMLKNTSLLDPNGYAYKRWTSGETSERSKFWVEKINKIDEKLQYESESIYDFSEDESQLFRKKIPKKRGRKKKSDIKEDIKIIGMVKKSEPKNKRKSSARKIKEETPKAKSAKIEKKKTPRKPAIKVERVKQKPEAEVEPKITIEVEPEIQPEIHEEPPELEPQPDILDESVINHEPVPEKIELENKETEPPEKLIEEEIGEPLEILNNETLPEENLYEEIVPPNDLGQNPETGNIDEKMNISSDESICDPKNYDNLILGRESSDDQMNNNIIVKELKLDSVIDPKLPVLKIDIEDGKIKIIQTNSKAVVENHQKELLERTYLDGLVNAQVNVRPCSSLNSSVNDTASSPRVVVNPLKTRKRYRKKKRDMNRKPKRKTTHSSSEEEKVKIFPEKIPEAKTDKRKREMIDSSSEEEKSKISPKKVPETKIDKPKRKMKESSSEAEKSGISPKKVLETKFKRKMKESSSDDDQLIITPKKTPQLKKRKIEESSDELSEEHEAIKNRMTEIITRLKERNKEKNKMETDKIIQTISEGNSQLLKSFIKKDSSKLSDYTKKIKEMIPDDSLEKDLSKKCERFEKCVTYFSAGCSVSELCEEMKESVDKVRESLTEEDSEDTKKDEERIGRFSTRLEAVINCQTETELKNQLKNTITRMFNVLSFSDDVNFY